MANRALDTIMERADQIRELGPSNEALGKLDDKAVQILRESGAIGLLQPKEYGGLEVHPRELAETVMTAASLDGSTGWIVGRVGVHPWEMAYADPSDREEVLSEDPVTWIASPYAPMGVARPLVGSYIFNGRCQFSSGTDHCHWSFLGGMLDDEDGQVAQPP